MGGVIFFSPTLASLIFAGMLTSYWNCRVVWMFSSWSSRTMPERLPFILRMSLSVAALSAWWPPLTANVSAQQFSQSEVGRTDVPAAMWASVTCPSVYGSVMVV
jgi:hypothetical protein